MVLRPTLTSVSLGLNCLLFALLALVALHTIIPREVIDFEKGPFHFSSWKDSSDETCFTLLWTDEPLDISLLRDYPINGAVEEGEPDKVVVIGLREEFSLWMHYLRSPDADLEITEIRFSRRRGSSRDEWIDYKADGSYDYHFLEDQTKHKGRDSVFLHGKWEDVVNTFGEFEKEVSGGRRVRFDWTSGLWHVVER